MANYTKRDQRRDDLRDALQGKPVKARPLLCRCGAPAKWELNLGPYGTQLYCDACVPKDALK